MPFGHNCEFPTFDSCVAHYTGKGESGDTARKICGALMRDTEASCAKKSKIIESDEEVEIIKDGPLVDAIAAALSTSDDPVIEQAFITSNSDGEDSLITESELVKKMLDISMGGFSADQIHDEVNNSPLLDVRKAVIDGSSQNDNEIDQSPIGSEKVVSPPFPPQLMAKFLEVDETHFRACTAKTADSVSRGWSLRPVSDAEGEELDPSDQDEPTKNKISEEKKVIKDFMRTANPNTTFFGAVEASCLDHEGVGWGAIEVIRNLDMRVVRIAHVPAQRMRVLRGWKGFVELESEGKHIYYLPFGQKVLNTDGEEYDPVRDGPLEASNPKLKWNFINRKDGKPTSNFAESANEILWIPRQHPNTIYYGYSDVIPALGHLLTNINIRDYLLQFFEHNTVPQYAIIIEGARVSPDVQKTIMDYFNTEVKGQAHKTLIIPIPATGAEVKVRFEKLGADHREGSFQDTRKNGASGIMVAHGTPPAILGIAEASELGSGKGLSQAEIYKDRIVDPSQRKWAGRLNRLFRMGLGVQMVELTFKPLDIRDKETEMKTHQGYINLGVMTINEVRAELGLDPIEGGNRAFVLTGQGPMFVDELEDQSLLSRQQFEAQMTQLSDEVRQAKQGGGGSPVAQRQPNTAEGNNGTSNGQGKTGAKGATGGRRAARN